jgi:hypothetical protein
MNEIPAKLQYFLQSSKTCLHIYLKITKRLDVAWKCKAAAKEDVILLPHILYSHLPVL